MTTNLKFTKVTAGHWATPDGEFAAVADGGERGLDDLNCRWGEWAAVHDPDGRLRTDHQAGLTLDWFLTKREAVAACQARHDRAFTEVLPGGRDPKREWPHAVGQTNGRGT